VLVLAVDTATPAVTAGLVEVGDIARVLAERITVDAKAHGELLTPHVRDALAEAGRELADVDAIVCGAGPGPFTGLRAGMVSAGALGHALGKPVYPVCSLDAIAAAVPGEPLLVVTDARRREVYWATYDAQGVRVDGPHVSPAAEVRAPHATRVAGADLHDFGLPLVEPVHPTPAGLVSAARAELLAGAEPGPLTPLYLRRPDAVVPGARKRVSPR
jgi:tRNA threonylcarbamoyl adenosine modification protein YeaZ